MSNLKCFLGIDLDLINNPKYEQLSFTAKGLYALYADRFMCSQHSVKNGDKKFVDKFGVFILYNNEDAASILGVTVRTITNLRKELVNVGLINIKRHGLTGYKIYVKPVQKTSKDIEWKMPWKNFDVNTGHDSVNVVEQTSNMQENISDTSEKKTLTSVTQGSVCSSETEVTRETHDAKQAREKSSTERLEMLALEGLKERTSDILGIRVWGKINMIAGNSYSVAKKLVDTIYKAKNQLSKRMRQTVLREFSEVPEVYNVVWDSMLFENNSLLSKGLESALLRIMEIYYKAENNTIANPDGFVYSFVRNSFASSVRLFVEDEVGESLTDEMRKYIYKSLKF